MTRISLLRKINACDGSVPEAKKIESRMELYRRNLRNCAAEFEVQMAPAVAKAVQDAHADSRLPLPAIFPRRTTIEDRVQAILPFNDKLPAGEALHEWSKRKSKSRAQKALEAMAVELQESTVLLASDFDKRVRDHVGMKMAVDTEKKLREGLAAEALDKLRLHLTTYLAVEQRRRNGSGVIHNTEIDNRLAEKRLAIERAKYMYRNQRHLLRVLGMPEDHAQFKHLLDEHCHAFAIIAEEFSRGDSHRLPSWIWGDFSYVAKVQDGDIRNFLDDSTSNSIRAGSQQY